LFYKTYFDKSKLTLNRSKNSMDLGKSFPNNDSFHCYLQEEDKKKIGSTQRKTFESTHSLKKVETMRGSSLNSGFKRKRKRMERPQTSMVHTRLGKRKSTLL